MDTAYCDGNDVSLAWRYDQVDHADAVTWQKGPTQIAGRSDEGPVKLTPSYNVEHVTNGEIKLYNTTASDSGNYSISVEYTLLAGFPTAVDIKPVIIYGRYFMFI